MAAVSDFYFRFNWIELFYSIVQVLLIAGALLLASLIYLWKSKERTIEFNQHLGLEFWLYSVTHL